MHVGGGVKNALGVTGELGPENVQQVRSWLFTEDLARAVKLFRWHRIIVERVVDAGGVAAVGGHGMF